jgi:hypothetical protein
VAQGAAIYGATREIPRNLRPGRSTGKSIQLTLEYEPAAKIPMLFVAGQVAGASAADRGLSVEFNRTDGLWKSGPIRVDADGFFTAELTLIDCGERTFSSFETILRNAEGSIIDRLDEPGVWYPLGETVMTLPSSFRVALHDNKSSVLVSAGSMLPVEVEMGPFYTIKDLAKGSNEDVLRIPIMEGVTDYFGDENERADSNLHIGTLVIEGNEAKVTRNVPAGAKVVINILVDVSQEITVVARVPVLREEFAATFHCEPAELPVEAVRLRFERLKAKLDRVRDLERRKPQEGVASLLERLDRMECVAQIEKQVGRAEGSEPGARQSAHEQVLRLAGTLHSIGKKQRRANIEDLIEGLEPCCKGELTAKLADLRSDFESASDDDNRALQRIESLLLALEQKARRGLCTDLLLDLMSSRGRKATAKQGAIVHRAEKLAEQFFVSGAGDDLSADELVEMNRIHEQLLEAYPELRAWREDNLRKSIDDASLALIESHIRSET